MNDKEKKLSLLVKEEKTVQLKRRICELENECQKLSRELMAFKQEKQTEKKDFPHAPIQKKEKIKEKNNYHDSKMGFENSKNESKKRSKKSFVPPTLDEVQAYMDEIGENRFTAVRFWNYYEAKGWILGKTKMKFWKMVLNNWCAKENNKFMTNKTPTPNKNIVTFNAYKPVDTKGAVNLLEYERMKREGLI